MFVQRIGLIVVLCVALASVASAQFTCSLDDQTWPGCLFAASAPTDATAAVCGTPGYAYRLHCRSDIAGCGLECRTVPSTENCRQIEEEVLTLSDGSEAHVGVGRMNWVPPWQRVCCALAGTNCGRIACHAGDEGESCPQSEAQIIRLSSSRGSHVSTDSGWGYPVCCGRVTSVPLFCDIMMTSGTTDCVADTTDVTDALASACTGATGPKLICEPGIPDCNVVCQTVGDDNACPNGMQEMFSLASDGRVNARGTGVGSSKVCCGVSSQGINEQCGKLSCSDGQKTCPLGQSLVVRLNKSTDATISIEDAEYEQSLCCNVVPLDKRMTCDIKSAPTTSPDVCLIDLDPDPNSHAGSCSADASSQLVCKTAPVGCQLSCSVRDNCTQGEHVMFGVSDTGHGNVNASQEPSKVCCAYTPTIPGYSCNFGCSFTPPGGLCDGTAQVVRLSDEDNAHFNLEDLNYKYGLCCDVSSQAPSVTPPGGGGGGTTPGGGCTSDWRCTWSECIDGYREAQCTNLKPDCNVPYTGPTRQQCGPVPCRGDGTRDGAVCDESCEATVPGCGEHTKGANVRFDDGTYKRCCGGTPTPAIRGVTYQTTRDSLHSTRVRQTETGETAIINIDVFK